MRSRVMLAVMALVLMAFPALATHEISIIASSPTADACAVAMNGGGTAMVAWQDEGGIHTHAQCGDVAYGNGDHGAGAIPEVCWTPVGFLLAWADGDSLKTRRFVADEWLPIESLAGGGQPVVSLALTGWQPALEFSDAYLCWEEQDKSLWFASRGARGWSSPELVLVHDSWDLARPRALPAMPSGELQPRIYYLSWDRLRYVDRLGESWSDPLTVTTNYRFGADFDVAAGPGCSQHVLALGPPPACPCNSILYTHSLTGGWLPPENITLNIDYYDLPLEPALGVNRDGRAHAFWRQETRDADQVLIGEEMAYFLREDNVWSDASGELDGHVGQDCDLGMEGGGDDASLVWTEYHDGLYSIYLADTGATGVASGAPGARFALSAYPNPFNPRTTLAWRLEAPADVTLRLYDGSGHAVRTLLDGAALPAGDARAAWDGRDDEGRLLPSGLYLARLNAGDLTSVRRLVLLK